MNNSNISLNQNIKLQVRVQVLYDVIKTLALSFGFPSSIENILLKGIVERQIFSTIYAYYINDKGKAVGKVSFNIDWDKYDIYASTDSGKNIRLKTNVPLIDQFATWATDIINYMKKMQTSLKVSKIKVFFMYRDEIRNDKQKDEEADKFLGLKKSTYKVDYDHEASKTFKRTMNFTSEMLPELEIEIQTDC